MNREPKDRRRPQRPWAQVEHGHAGPMIAYTTGEGCTILECSYAQAAFLHRRSPLILDHVVAADTAIFRPAGAGDCAPALLPAPPYEMAGDPRPPAVCHGIRAKAEVARFRETDRYADRLAQRIALEVGAARLPGVDRATTMAILAEIAVDLDHEGGADGSQST